MVHWQMHECCVLPIFSSPPGRKADGSGWDAIEFWMRGRDALSMTAFVSPYNNGQPLKDDGARRWRSPRMQRPAAARHATQAASSLAEAHRPLQAR